MTKENYEGFDKIYTKSSHFSWYQWKVSRYLFILIIMSSRRFSLIFFSFFYNKILFFKRIFLHQTFCFLHQILRSILFNTLIRASQPPRGMNATTGCANVIALTLPYYMGYCLFFYKIFSYDSLLTRKLTLFLNFPKTVLYLYLDLGYVL